MAQNICQISDELTEKLKKFRFKKSTGAALIMKITNGVVEIDSELEECSVEDVQEELPSHQPRFVELIYKYDHSDGRVSYPLCFVFVTPQGCKPDMQMRYAGSMHNVIQKAGVSKVFELRDVEELTEDWLLSKLDFFK